MFLVKAIKYAVSGKRHRFVQGKYDLDLAYITPNVLAMGFPGEGVEGMYRNNLDEVAEFLNERHKNHYMVWNLSEKLYDYAKLDNQVLIYGFPDHHNPPLDLLFSIIKSIHSWLQADTKNVSITHCLAGKGRTGTVIACYLLYCGQFSDPQQALDYFWDKRGEGVHTPSQIRYVKYFDYVLKNKTVPHRKPFVLKKIFVHFGNLLNATGIHLNIYEMVNEGPNSVKKKLKYTTKDNDKMSMIEPDIITYSTNILLQGDVLMTCSAPGLIKNEKYFRFAFHTGFLPLGMLRLTKKDMDDTSKKFPDQFMIDLIFQEVHEEHEFVPDEETKLLYSGLQQEHAKVQEATTTTTTTTMMPIAEANDIPVQLTSDKETIHVTIGNDSTDTTATTTAIANTVEQETTSVVVVQHENNQVYTEEEEL